MLEPSGQGYAALPRIRNNTHPVRAATVGVDALRAAALLLIGAGLGCDAVDDNETVTDGGTNLTTNAERDVAREAWGLR